MTDINESRIERWNKLLKAMASGEPLKRKAMLGETRNPLPEKDYTSKQQPYCDDEENDPEIDGR
jgi:hypothetical protein